MLGVLAKPFTGLQMTQLAGELQRLFALRSELRFRSCICVLYFVSLTGRVDPAVWPGCVPNSSRCGFIAKICESAGARNWQPGINRHLQARNMHVSVRGNPTATWNKDLVRPQIARESMLMRAVLKGKYCGQSNIDPTNGVETLRLLSVHVCPCPEVVIWILLKKEEETKK